MVITGYRMKSVSLEDTESAIKKIAFRIGKIADKEYNELLGEEIASICDLTSLNVFRKEDVGGIYTSALNSLNERSKRQALSGLRRSTTSTSTPTSFVMVSIRT